MLDDHAESMKAPGQSMMRDDQLPRIRALATRIGIAEAARVTGWSTTSIRRAFRRGGMGLPIVHSTPAWSIADPGGVASPERIHELYGEVGRSSIAVVAARLGVSRAFLGNRLRASGYSIRACDGGENRDEWARAWTSRVSAAVNAGASREDAERRVTDEMFATVMAQPGEGGDAWDRRISTCDRDAYRIDIGGSRYGASS